MSQDPHTDRGGAPLPPTPALDRLIERVRARLGRLVLLHGLGTTAAVAAAWLAFAFLLDWTLHLPAPVRVFHLLVLVALPAFVASRWFVRPLRARPDRAGTAVLIERAHPGHDQQHQPVPTLDQLQDAEDDERPEHVELLLDGQRPEVVQLGVGGEEDP